MRRALFLILFGLVLVLPALARDRRPPRPVKSEPAIGDFTSVNYPMTFKAPASAFFCPLSPDWVGSDHGTTVFLARPKACYGAGYPSSSRGFEPGDFPRIVLGVATMSIFVTLLNRFGWRRLFAMAERRLRLD